MATIQEAIKRLRYIFTSEGADKVVADQNKVGAAVVASTTTQEKAVLSLEKSFAGIERRFNSQIRAQQDYEKVQRQVNAAVAQNPALQERANAVLALAQRHFDQTSRSNKAFSAATQAANDNLQSMTAGLGVAGRALAALGPVGIAVAVVLGATAIAIHQMVEASVAFADKAGKLVDFAETTGLSTDALQALHKAASQVGITADQVGTNIERFSAQFSELRRGAGQLYEQLLEVNPALAQQMAQARSVAQALDLYNKAVAQSNELDRVRLARAAFGRGGAGMVRLSTYADDRGGLTGLIGGLNEADLRSQELLRRVDELGDKIKYNSDKAKENIISIFAGPTLDALLWFTEKFLELSRYMNRVAAGPASFESRWQDATQAPFKQTTKGQLDNAATIRAAEDMKRYMQVLGDAATPAEKLRMKQLELAAAVAKNGDVADAARRNLADYNEEIERGNLARRVGLLGELASVSEIVKNRQNEINKAVESGVRISEQEKTALLEKTRIQATAAIPENQVKFEREILSLSQEEVSIRQKLIAWGIDYNSVRGQTLAQEMRIIDLMRSAQDVAGDFAKTFASGILDGRDAVESLLNALDNLAKKLLDAGINNLLSGALSGNLVQAAIGAVEIAAAFLIDMFSDTTNAQREAEKQLEEAKKKWDEMQEQYLDFIGVLNGTVMGSVTKQLREVTKTAFEMGRAAYEAKDWQSLIRIVHDFNQFVQRTAEEFARSFPVMIEALNAGQGFESPLLAGVQKTKQIADQLKGFLDDTQNMFSILGGWHLEGMVPVGTGDASSQVEMARKAAQTFALSLLDTSEPLSDTAKSILEMRGVALQLQVTLQELGMSAEEAAAAIETKMAAAMAILRTKLTDDLQREINEASGKGFINQVADLIKQRDQMLKDFALAGADTGLIPRFFEVQAQKIIDQADLSGEAFGNLIALFPELTGVVHASTRALEEQKKAEEERQRALNQSARTIVDYVNSLLTGQQSPLSPAARLSAAQSTYTSQIVLAQGGNLDALNSITKYADAYLQAANDMFASSAAYQQIFNAVTGQLINLPAVVQSTDPVVQAIRDSIIAIQDTTSAVELMRTTLSGVLTSGNPSQIALALQTYFSTLDTSVNGLLDFNELLSGLNPLAKQATLAAIDVDGDGQISKLELIRASTQAIDLNGDGQIDRLDSQIGHLANIFATLDADGDGQISRLELIKAAAQETRDSTQIVIDKNEAIRVLQEASGNLLGTANSLQTSANTILNSQAALLDQIRALNATASSQLDLLNSQFSGSVSVSYTKFTQTGGSVTVTETLANNMIVSLNKIVLNTWATSYNTATLVARTNSTDPYYIGQKAFGGWIRGPGGPMDDRAGTYRLSNGEHVTNAISARYNAPILDAINAARGPIDIRPIQMLPSYSMAANDNYSREIVLELRRLYARIEQLESRIVTAEMRGAQVVRDSVDELHDQNVQWRESDKKQKRVAVAGR